MLGILPAVHTVLPGTVLTPHTFLLEHFLLCTLDTGDTSYHAQCSPGIQKLLYPEYFLYHTLVYHETSSPTLLPGHFLLHTLLYWGTSYPTHCRTADAS